MRISACIIISVICFAIHLPSPAQYIDANLKTVPPNKAAREVTDSLWKTVEPEKADTNKVKHLALLSYYYFDIADDSAILVGHQALQLADALNAPLSRILALKALADAFYREHNLDSSTYYWQFGLDICRSEHLYIDGISNFMTSLNNNFFLQGNYTEAMKISAEGLTIAEKIKDHKWTAHYANALGFIMLQQKDYSSCRYYYIYSLQQAAQIKDQYMEANALLNLGDLSLVENKLSEARDFYSQTLHFFQEPDFDHRMHNPVERIAYAYNKLAEVDKLSGNEREALVNSLLAIHYAQHTANEYDMADYYIRGGDIYNQLLLPDSAILFLRTGLGLAFHINHRQFIDNAYKQLSIAFAQMKRYDSAYAYQSLFLHLQDTLNQENNHREIIERETNLKIEKQKQAEEAALQKQRNTRNIIIGIAAFLIAIILLLYNRNRLKQKNKYQAELNRQQQEVLGTTIAVQDQERKRIAEDLHDGLGSILSAAKLKLSDMETDLDGDKKEKLEDGLSLIDEAVNEMKNIAYNMMPATLSRLGLEAALQNLFTRLSKRSGLKIHYTVFGFSKRLEESAELGIYRIVLECINNTVKHAEAENVTVQLLQYPDYINITIEDDGKGFAWSSSAAFSGNGLNNIASRVKNLKGNFDIDTQPGKGTTILVDIPYPQ